MRGSRANSTRYRCKNARSDGVRRGGSPVRNFENVYYNLVNEPMLLQREAALGAVMDGLNELRRRLRDQSLALVVERSYGDFEKLPIMAQRQLQIAGILPRFVDSRVDKSRADIEL